MSLEFDVQTVIMWILLFRNFQDSGYYYNNFQCSIAFVPTAACPNQNLDKWATTKSEKLDDASPLNADLSVQISCANRKVYIAPMALHTKERGINKCNSVY